MAQHTTTVSPKPIAFDNIQGNIFGGFNKDYQTLLFLHFSNAKGGRTWLKEIINEVASSEEVLAFNALFKKLNERRHKELGVVKATWMNIAFTHSGLAALGVTQADLNAFPPAFRQGMKARAVTIGDVGDSATDRWVQPLGSTDIHAVLIVASDSLPDLQQHVLRYIQGVERTATVNLRFVQQGAVRPDQPGHEHFGFKDGVSQPGIKGVDKSDPGNPEPDQGHPGQDLLWPGEFVLGYETQLGHAAPGKPDDLNLQPGPISTSGPAWTENGSYMVFRRLRQDVPAFHKFVEEKAKELGPSIDVMGAKLVGRYASGAPLELSKDPNLRIPDPNTGDPSAEHPVLLTDKRDNFFEYGDDPDGVFVPRAAHIRKAYPRDQVDANGNGENETQKHRLLRRGIPFGTHIGMHPDNNDTDRGLLFIAYQADIENQFEFVQNAWVNNANFPQPDPGAGAPLANDDGQDPIIAQRDAVRDFRFPVDGREAHIKLMHHFVTTTGGDYFFQPAISALRHIAG